MATVEGLSGVKARDPLVLVGKNPHRNDESVTVSRIGTKYIYVECNGRERPEQFDRTTGIEKGGGGGRLYTPAQREKMRLHLSLLLRLYAAGIAIKIEKRGEFSTEQLQKMLSVVLGEDITDDTPRPETAAAVPYQAERRGGKPVGTAKPREPWRVILLQDGTQLVDVPHTSQAKAFQHVRTGLQAGGADTAKVMQWESGRWQLFETVRADEIPPGPPQPAPFRIERGQIYRSLGNRHHPVEGPTRIKVVEDPVATPGLHGFGKVDVVTLKNGREIRRRPIELSQLHASATTQHGKPRLSGYVLVREGGENPARQGGKPDSEKGSGPR